MLAKKERAMMTKACFTQDIRLRLCKEAFMCTTILDNLTTKTINEKKQPGMSIFTTRNQHLHRTCQLLARQVHSKEAYVESLGTEESL